MITGQQVEIPFNSWSTERLLQERKNCTSRRLKYGTRGDWFIIAGRKYVILKVQKMQLWLIKKNLWKTEGADNEEEFELVWRSIHRGRFDGSKHKWVHYFKYVGGVDEGPKKDRQDSEKAQGTLVKKPRPEVHPAADKS